MQSNTLFGPYMFNGFGCGEELFVLQSIFGTDLVEDGSNRVEVCSNLNEGGDCQDQNKQINDYH